VSEPIGRELWRRNVRRSAAAIVASNALAAVVVFVYLSWVVPVPSVARAGRVTFLNLVVFTLYLAVAFPIGWVWSIRGVRPIRDWTGAGREPTHGERDLVLRAPLHQLQILAAGWGGAALLFFAVNVAMSRGPRRSPRAMSVNRWSTVTRGWRRTTGAKPPRS